MVYYIFAYITGGISILIALFTYLFPKRNVQLLFKASSDFIGILNLLFIMLAKNDLIMLSGIICLVVGLIRDFVFYFRNKSKYLNHIAWPIGFSVILLCSLIWTYKGPISLLPAIGSVISTMALYCNNQKISKSGVAIALSLYVVYYALLIPKSDVLTIFSLCNSAAGFVSAVVGLIILLKKSKNQKNQ